ncbi:MAG: hypothetical protein LBV37_01385 [Mycoplasmataceae bacterium]|jgi:hypothetical protein|nr:hypothetical protein [Mycoplasmataceae bacterium]
MSKKMYEVKIEKRIDKDNLIIAAQSLNTKKSSTAKRSTIEIVVDVLQDILPGMINAAIKPIVDRLDKIDQRLDNLVKINNLKE